MLYKHKVIQLPIYLFLSGCYIVLKFLISPLLYVFRRLGLNSSWLSKIDARMNKAILPLTETPENNQKTEVNTSLELGEKLPTTDVKLSNGSILPINKLVEMPLLLVFVRGSWCSYSRLHLSDLMLNKESFDNAGINLMAVTSYNDESWWISRGIDIPILVDPEGKIFDDFGIRVKSWLEFTWGRILPHESAFLFNEAGFLVAKDVRKVSSIFPGQRFLGSNKWIEIADKRL